MSNLASSIREVTEPQIQFKTTGFQFKLKTPAIPSNKKQDAIEPHRSHSQAEVMKTMHDKPVVAP